MDNERLQAKRIKRIAFVSPQKLYYVEGGLKVGATARPNVSVPALLVLGMLKQEGYERFFVDAVAEAPGNLEEVAPGVFKAGLSNMQIADKLEEFAPDVVLTTAMFSFEYFLTNELVAELKNRMPRVPIIVGGIAATAHPHWFMESGAVDVTVLGEAEATLLPLLRELEKPDPDLRSIPNLVFLRDGKVENTRWIRQLGGTFPQFDYDSVLLLPDGGYRYDDRLTSRTETYRFGIPQGETRSCVFFGSRGCPMACDYCATSWRDGRMVRHMGAERLFGELKVLHEKFGVTIFYNQADTLGFHPEDKKVLALVAEYRRTHPEIVLNNPNAFFVRIFFKPDGSLDEEFVDLLAQAGFNVVTLAVETFIQRFNKKIDFKRITFEKIAALCDAIGRKGMKTDIYAIYCFPGQTEEEMLYDLRMFRELRGHVSDFSLYNLGYLPGTTYYEQALREGWFTEEQYKLQLHKGYSFHHLIDFFNLSKIETNRLKGLAAEFKAFVPVAEK